MYFIFDFYFIQFFLFDQKVKKSNRKNQKTRENNNSGAGPTDRDRIRFGLRPNSTIGDQCAVLVWKLE